MTTTILVTAPAMLHALMDVHLQIAPSIAPATDLPEHLTGRTVCLMTGIYLRHRKKMLTGL